MDRSPRQLDLIMLVTTAGLVAVGLAMVASASMSVAVTAYGDPFGLLKRQIAHLAIGVGLGAIAIRVDMRVLERFRGPLLIASLVLVALVFVPGMGREVNGSQRWLSLGVIGLQPSEILKLVLVVFVAGYIKKFGDEIEDSPLVILRLLGIVAAACLLLLLQPDLGAAIVVSCTALAMLFLANVRFKYVGVLIVLMVGMLSVLVATSPYRMARISAFIDPWQDPFDKGFQLTQALIAYGRGEWTGVGLGAGIQKLFYLPEAHTDFLLAVFAEEVGVVGVVCVVLAFLVFVWRGLRIGDRALANDDGFSALVAYGISIWVGIQAFINIGVSMGVLPTKGITLPLMSYGGSSLVITCIGIAILLRISMDHDDVSKRTFIQAKGK